MNEIVSEYLDKFGQDLNIFIYSDDALKKAEAEMKLALDGKRGPLTDKEFGQEVPDDAVA